MFRVKVSASWVYREVKQYYGGATHVDKGFVRAVRRELAALIETDLEAGCTTSSKECLGIAIDTVGPAYNYMQIQRANTEARPGCVQKSDDKAPPV